MGHNRNLADYAHHFDGTHIDLGSGNIETQGVLTYEDVTNVDAIGIITARAGVKVPDNQKVLLGTGDDLQIFHNGNHSVIADVGTGNLQLRAEDFRVTDSTNAEVMIRANTNAEVELYYNNSKKLETTTTGATVTGTLVSDGVTSELDLSAISSSISDTAVDVFVYDTRKDSDGGAWRKRTQHTSWYNETLNTSTRGSRKEFPAVAVIVTETRKVTIYDGDDPDLPMWMIFNAGSGNALYYPNNSNATSTVMLNGKLANAASGGSPRFRTIDFLSDSHLEYSHTDGRTTFNINVSQRNAGLATFNYGNVPGAGIIHRDCNDVAMTVLPNAPIDYATGLPIPTIAVATNAGISVITDQGNVYDLTTNDVYDSYGKVEFGDNNRLYYTANGTQVLYSSVIPSADQNYTAYNTQNTNRVMFPSMDHGGFTTGHPVRLLGTNGSIPYLIAKNKASGSNETSYAPSDFGIRPGLTFIDEGETNPTSMVAYCTSSYNTGWMQGDIKGAFLSDTDTTNITGGNIVTNGDAWTGAQSSTSSTPPTGWTGGNAAQFKTHSGGDGTYIRLVNAGSSQGGPNSYMYQAITTVPGRKYKISLTQYHHATISVYYRVGTSINGNQLTYRNWTSSSSNTPRDQHDTFTATGTTTYLTLGITSGTNNYDTGWDNVIITEVDEDRSVNANGLHSYGTVTKSAVATGADLVAYSNFSASNHFRQPPNSDMNIGTGDAYEMIWFKTTNASGTMMMISYEGGANGTNDYGKPFNIRYENGSVRGWASHNSFSTNDDVNHGVSTADGKWHCAAWVKRGQVFELYIDGEFIGSDTGAVGSNALSDSNSELVIGARKRGKAPGDSEEPWNNGSLALARIGKSAPTAQQIKKIYNDEKHLFQENAKATLYSSSDAVTALAYDEVTEQLHVGTSSGRSDFQGLCRINNTTTAVTTAISAHDEFIVEQ